MKNDFLQNSRNKFKTGFYKELNGKVLVNLDISFPNNELLH